MSIPHTDFFSTLLDLPVTFDPVWVGVTSESTAAAVSQVQIEPVSVVPRTGRPAISNIRQVELIDNEAGRYAIHVDDNIFAERTGFWVRGGHASSLHVTPRGASTLRVTVRNGAMPGPVVLDVGGRGEVVELGPRQRHEITLPLAENTLAVPLTIEAANGFRPSEQDTESRDRRFLGCWVTLELE